MSTLDLSNYHVTFDDEFNNLSLDESYAGGSEGTWKPFYQNWGIRTLGSNAEQEIYVDPLYQGNTNAPLGLNPFSVSNGVLTISANPTPASDVSATGGFPYTSGMLTTQGNWSQEYGYFEMRAELPQGQGLWPAFWLYDAGSGTPSEIDIFEQLGNQPGIAHQTQHFPTGGGQMFDTSVDTSGGFHDYGVMWNAKTVTFYIDGQATASMPNTINVPMFLIANLAVGGSWGGNPDSSTSFPANMQIDSIKAWTENSPSNSNPNNDPTAIRVSDVHGHIMNLEPLAQGAVSVVPSSSGFDQSVSQSVGSDGVVTLATPQWNDINKVNVHDTHGGSWAANGFLEADFSISGAQNGSLLLTDAKRGIIDLSHSGSYDVKVNAHSNAADPSVNGVAQHLNDFAITTGSGQNTITVNGYQDFTNVVLSTGSGHTVLIAEHTGGTNIISFGSGRAEITGGHGTNNYLYHANSGVDIIQNFDSSHDTITLDSSLKAIMHTSHGAEGTTLMFGGSTHELVLHAISNFDTNTIHWN